MLADAVRRTRGKLFPQPGAAVVQAKQFHDGIDVGFASNVVRHPSGIGMKIVHVRLSFSDELFANANRKGQVRQPLTVQVTNFPPSDMKENHSSTMRFRRHSGQRQHFPCDPFGN